jgi:hypothetical protein
LYCGRVKSESRAVELWASVCGGLADQVRLRKSRGGRQRCRTRRERDGKQGARKTAAERINRSAVDQMLSNPDV